MSTVGLLAGLGYWAVVVLIIIGGLLRTAKGDPPRYTRVDGAAAGLSVAFLLLLIFGVVANSVFHTLLLTGWVTLELSKVIISIGGKHANRSRG